MRLSNHPLALVLRFSLEVAGLIAIGYWGWHAADSVKRSRLILETVILLTPVWLLRATGAHGLRGINLSPTAAFLNRQNLFLP
jgi:hypothetical protein